MSDENVDRVFVLNHSTEIKVVDEDGEKYRIEIGGSPSLAAHINKCDLIEGLKFGYIQKRDAE